MTSLFNRVLGRHCYQRYYQVKMMSTSGSTPGRLSGKVAIVTASTEGIGYAIARRLGQDGAKVMVSSRKQEKVDAAVATLKAENLAVAGTVCHVANSQDRHDLIKKTVELFGGIDILVSNAATSLAFGPVLEATTEKIWDKTFDTNVKAGFFLTKEAVPYMEKRGGGRVIFVSSYAGYTPIEEIGCYSVSKTALLGVTKMLVPALAPKNITVNCLAPGVIRTKFAKALTETPGLADTLLNQVPLKRFGTPEDCSGTVSFLASDDAAYMTGETLLVTGGMSARL